MRLIILRASALCRATTSSALRLPRQLCVSGGGLVPAACPDHEAVGSASHVWHFSYGANLSQRVLARRGVRPVRALKAVVPPDVALRFQHRGGFATLVVCNAAGRFCEEGSLSSADGADVRHPLPVQREESVCSIRQPHGMLYLLSAADMKALSTRETGYGIVQLCVTPYDSSAAVVASVYVSRPALRLPRALPPTVRYKRLLVDGAKQCGLEPSYVSVLEQLPTVVSGGLPPEYFDTPSGLPATLAAVMVLALAIGVVMTRH